MYCQIYIVKISIKSVNSILFFFNSFQLQVFYFIERILNNPNHTSQDKKAVEEKIISSIEVSEVFQIDIFSTLS